MQQAIRNGNAASEITLGGGLLSGCLEQGPLTRTLNQNRNIEHMKELEADGSQELLQQIPEICVVAYPNATFEIRPHTGRPGYSIYGSANWEPALTFEGDISLERFVCGAVAALRYVNHVAKMKDYMKAKMESKPCPVCGGTHPVGCCAQDGHGG